MQAIQSTTIESSHQILRTPNVSTILKDNNVDLTNKQLAILNEYVNNGYNKTRAYLTVNPHLQYQTAAVNACNLFKNAKFTKAVELCINGLYVSSTRKENVTLEMLAIQQRAFKNNQLNVALSAVVERAKLHRLYDSDETDVKKYETFVKALQINVNIDNKREEPKFINPKDVDISNTYDVRADDIQSAVLPNEGDGEQKDVDEK